MTSPARLPDAVSLETVLAGLDPASADADLIPAFAAAFPGFEFGVARIDDDYWRDTRSVIRPEGTRLGELRPWMKVEKRSACACPTVTPASCCAGPIGPTASERSFRRIPAPSCGPTGPGTADDRADRARSAKSNGGRPDRRPDYRPLGEEELLDPSCRAPSAPGRIAGAADHRYAVAGWRGDPRPELSRWLRSHRAREAGGPAARDGATRHWRVGPAGTRETRSRGGPGLVRLRAARDPILSGGRIERGHASRLCAWRRIRDDTRKGEREVGFIPRHLATALERLLATLDVSSTSLWTEPRPSIAKSACPSAGSS